MAVKTITYYEVYGNEQKGRGSQEKVYCRFGRREVAENYQLGRSLRLAVEIREVIVPVADTLSDAAEYSRQVTCAAAGPN